MKTKKLLDVLGVQFAPKSGYTPAIGDTVELSGDMEVQKVATAGSTKIVGDVVAIEDDAYNTPVAVTVDTGASLCRDMTSGAAIAAVGPVVLDANSKVIAYVPPTYNTATGVKETGHDPAAIIGLALNTTSAADKTVSVLRFR